MGLSEDAIIESLAAGAGPGHAAAAPEGQRRHVLNDAYNANPNSMRAALETLVALPTRGPARRGARRHARAGRSQRALPPRDRRARGDRASSTCWCASASRPALIADAAEARGHADGRDRHASPTPPPPPSAIRGVVRDGDLVLLKASRGIELEVVAKAIAEHENEVRSARSRQ